MQPSKISTKHWISDYPPKLIMWDWDGTVVNTYPSMLEALNHTFDKLNDHLKLRHYRHWTYRRIKEEMHGPPEECYRRAFDAEHIPMAKEIRGKFLREHHARNLCYMENAEATLEFFKKKSIRQIVVSNKNTPLLMEESKLLGNAHFFDVLQGIEEGIEAKPSAMPALIALKKINLSLEAKSTWFIGDTESDIGCARALGCVPIHLSDTDLPKIPPDGSTPILRVRDHSELLAIVQNL